MKKLLFLFVVVLSVTQANAQISENFSGLTLTSTTVGTSTINIGGLPANWQDTSVDGLTPNSNFSYMGTNAWISRELTFSNNTKDTVMQSISWYAPIGTSNDWLITPQFMVPTATTTDEIALLWEALAQDPQYPDGYQVKLSTTGTALADFTVTLATIAAESATGFTARAADLTPYAGQNVYVAFINNSNDKYVLYIDDIRTAKFSSFDAEMSSVQMTRYERTNTNVDIKGTVKNNGKTITALNIEWNDGGTPNTATLTGLNIPPLASYDFTHSIAFNKTATDEYSIAVNISQVNGGVTESNTSNNSKAGKISTISNPPVRNVLFEEGTGLWCGWCPRGDVAMKAMYNSVTDGTFIGIAVHNGDPMTVTDYDNGADISGFPGCNVDRTILGESVSTSLWQSTYNSRKSAVTPASVSHSASLNPTTRELTVEVQGSFKTKISTGLRLGVIIVEDNVSDPSYNQSNYYANNQNGAMGGYESLPNPVPGSQMIFDHVGRALLGGYDGQTGSVPATVTDNSTASHVFNYTVPNSMSTEELKIVSVIIDESNGQIINATETKLYPVATNDIAKENSHFTVYPSVLNSNSFNASFNVNNKEVSIEVFTMWGVKVYSQNIGKVNGNQNILLHLPELSNGQYLVNLNTPGQTDIKRIIIAK